MVSIYTFVTSYLHFFAIYVQKILFVVFIYNFLQVIYTFL